MQTLNRWIERRAREAARRPSLEAALLGGGFVRYAAGRLWPVFANRLAATAVHVLEFTLLIGIFAERSLVTALALTNLAAVADAFYWGALEEMRTRLRTGGRSVFAEEMLRWIPRAVQLALLTLAVSLGMGVWRAWHGAELSVLEGYAAACGLRLAIDILVRTYHSGVYARQRVYRPTALIVALETSSLIATLALWKPLGAWCFPVGVTVSTLLSRALAMRYVLRAYRVARLRPPPLRLFGPRRRRPRRPLAPLLLAGAANLSSRLGSALVLVGLLRVSLWSRRLDAFTYALHLIAPLVAGASGWGRVLYHDWKRLDDDLARTLRQRLERRLLPLASTVGVIHWAAAAGIALGLLGWARVGVPTLALLPLFAALAWLSAQSLRSFALGDFRSLALASALLSSSLALALVAGGERADAGFVLTVAAILIGCTVVLLLLGASRRRPAPLGMQGTLQGWLRALSEVEGTVCVGAALLAESRAGQLAKRAAQLIGDRGALVVLGKRLLWFERAPARVGRRELVLATAGMIRRTQLLPPAPDWQVALQALVEAGLLRRPSVEARAEDELVREFRRRFPDGIVADLSTQEPAREMAEMPPPLRRLVWSEALASARRGRAERRRSGFEVTSFRPGGEIRLLFLAARTVDGAERSEWRKHVESANWHASQLVHRPLPPVT